jgi:DNA-binding protein HU-beta
MNKAELIHQISTRTRMSKKEVNLLLTCILEVIITTVSSGEPVRLVGFGSFKLREKKEREGRNPRTGNPIIIKASKIATFSAGKFFREKLIN